MSDIRSAARHILSLLLVTVVFLAGCQSVPPAPTGHQVRPSNAVTDNNRYDDDSQDSGITLWPPGKRKPATPGATDPAAGPGQVQQASLVQPLPPVENLHNASPIPVLDADDYDEGRVPAKKKDGDSASLPDRVMASVKSMAGLGPDRNVARQDLAKGKELMKAKKYKEAASKFKSAASRWPDSTLEEDAMFWQGECLFFADEYAKSYDAFSMLLKKHDNTRYLDTVSRRLFATARYWEQAAQATGQWALTPNFTDASRPRFDTWGMAMKAYEMVTTHDPTGPLADDSLMALGNAYFLRRRYEEAASYYDRLRKEYPKSPHQLQSHLLGMKAREMVYQGSEYDRQPLDEAAKIAEETLLQFGPELGQQRDELIKTRDRLAAKRAERDWEMAQFYESKRAYGAARFYYREILKLYPHTAMARQAETRLTEIKDYPAKPPNRLKFLTDLFPDGTRR
ncbi:MAG: tetratricopeptide repeat protein [Pirellulales bacterium]|nr:tetratricopeptide repeat protein [Pirellulales bacterium]